MARLPLDPELVEAQNRGLRVDLARDFDDLAGRLARRGVAIEPLVARASALRVAIPSWGVGTGGTRFGRFPLEGEPRDVFEKLEDCAVVQQLVRITPSVSLHIPWDVPDDADTLLRHAAALGLGFDAMNSNTFEDQPGQGHSYKFGSLTHVDAAVRAQAIAHSVDVIALGRRLGSRALTVWIGDGGNFPGQQHFRRALERYVASLREIYAALPADWRLFLEHKLYEPAFYSTVNNDWGTSYWAATQVGERCQCLVDLGHHAPNTNIEMIVARLIQLERLGGFHMNDSKYGDDDLDSGAIHPFQLFLVFCELVDAEREGPAGFDPAYMLDQSHNVTDPLESLALSAVEVQRAYVKAWLVDRARLAEAQARNDALGALACLKQAFHENVEPLLARARDAAGGAIEPLACYRASGWREAQAKARPAAATRLRGGIV
jgi:L-rhamnose isomerase/sugar isomerase